MFKRILVPVDGSDHAIKALQTARKLVMSLPDSASVTVLHVKPQMSFNEPPVGVDFESRLEEEGRNVLKPAKSILAYIPGEARLLMKHGDPAQLICTTAAEEKTDLIIMGTRGLGLVKGMILGSVSHAVIQHAHCPVLTVK